MKKSAPPDSRRAGVEVERWSVRPAVMVPIGHGGAGVVAGRGRRLDDGEDEAGVQLESLRGLRDRCRAWCPVIVSRLCEASSVYL